MVKKSSVYIWGKWSSQTADEVLASPQNPSSLSSSLEPILVPELRNKNISLIAGGRFFSASLSENGSLWTWGNSEFGQLGQGSVIKHNFPRIVKRLLQHQCLSENISDRISYIDLGSDHCLVLTASGKMFSWGSNNGGQLGNGRVGRTDVLKRQNKLDICLQELREKRTSVLGSLENQLSADILFQSGAYTFIPHPITFISHITIIQVTAGGCHNLALSDTGEVYSWGLGNNGRLGHGDKKSVSVPTLIQTLKGKTVMQIACGWSHSMCLIDEGQVYCWGKGHDGRLGIAIAHDQLLPAEVRLKERVITLSGGYCHSAALTVEKNVYTWGNNQYGQLGIEDTSKNQISPVLVKSLLGTSIVQVECGGFHTLAVSDEGQLFVWGMGQSGQLGLSDQRDHWKPTLVEGLSSFKVQKVAAGLHHSLALVEPFDVNSVSISSACISISTDSETPGKPDQDHTSSASTATVTSNSHAHHNGQSPSITGDMQDPFVDNSAAINKVIGYTIREEEDPVIKENDEYRSKTRERFQAELRQYRQDLATSPQFRDSSLQFAEKIATNLSSKPFVHSVEEIHATQRQLLRIDQTLKDSGEHLFPSSASVFPPEGPQREQVSEKKTEVLRQLSNLPLEFSFSPTGTPPPSAVASFESLPWSSLRSYSLETDAEYVPLILDDYVDPPRSPFVPDRNRTSLSQTVPQTPSPSPSPSSSSSSSKKNNQSPSASPQTAARRKSAKALDKRYSVGNIVDMKSIPSQLVTPHNDEPLPFVHRVSDFDDVLIFEDYPEPYNMSQPLLFANLPRFALTPENLERPTVDHDDSSSSSSSSTQSTSLTASGGQGATEGSWLKRGANFFSEIFNGKGRKDREYKQQLQEDYKLAHTWLFTVIPRWDNIVCDCKGAMLNKRLWRQGIPPMIRGIVWQRAIKNDLGLTEQHYYQLVAMKKNNVKHLRTIMADLPRTFPNFGLFNKNGPLHEDLFNVLCAFDLCYESIGYAQGMSYMAAMLLLHMDPPQAFISMMNLFHSYFFFSMYNVNMERLVKYIQLFEVLLSFELPEIYKHFLAIGLQPEHYLIDWLLTAYVKALNFEACCRVWDCFILEGEGFLFEFTWAIFRYLSPQLLKSNFEEALMKLNDLNNLPPSALFSQLDRSDAQINVNTFLQDIAMKMGSESDHSQSSQSQVQAQILEQIQSHQMRDKEFDLHQHDEESTPQQPLSTTATLSSSSSSSTFENPQSDAALDSSSSSSPPLPSLLKKIPTLEDVHFL